MKNFFVSFALFAALIFVVSCGDVTVNTPDTSDSGETVTDDDTGNTGSTDSEPTGDTTPDDDTDTGVVGTTEAEKCADRGGTWGDGKCTRTFDCSDKPEHAVWNGESSITQTLDFADWSWSPELPYSEYSEEAGTCHFKCEENYLWGLGNEYYEHCVSYEEICEMNDGATWNASQNKCTRTVNCNASLKPEHTVWNGESSITQTFNFADWSWSPNEGVLSLAYSEEEGLCHYKCEEGYLWVDGNSKCESYAEVCEINEGAIWNASQNKCTRTVNCSEKPANTVWNGESSYTQTFNFADWSWSPNEGMLSLAYSEEEGFCHFKCNGGYFWNNTACVNGCTGDPCNSDPNSTGVCTSTGMTTFECGCDPEYVWNGSSCALTSCEIDDSFAASDYENHFIFKGAGSVNSSYNISSDATVSAIELDLSGDAYNFNNYNSAGLINIDDNLYLDVVKSLSTHSYLELSSKISGDVLNNAEILPNGKVNLNAPLTELYLSEYLYLGEESVVKNCYVAQNQYTDNDFNTKSGRAQLCLGDNRNFEIGESIKIGVDVELNSDEEYIAAVLNHLDKELCTFYCMAENAEVKDAETGRCGCKDGYVWENGGSSCVEYVDSCSSNPCRGIDHWNGACTPNGEDFECGCEDGYDWNGTTCVLHVPTEEENYCIAAGGTWNGTHCTLDGFPVCSATSDTPCIDPETRLIWSTAITGVTAANVVSECQEQNYGGYTDWQTATISQLRSIVTNCPNLELGGACGVTDDCSASSCLGENNDCYSECASDSKLGDSSRTLISSTRYPSNYTLYWTLSFSRKAWDGNQISFSSTDSSSVYTLRCTRCPDGYGWNGSSCE